MFSGMQYLAIGYEIITYDDVQINKNILKWCYNFYFNSIKKTLIHKIILKMPTILS